MKTIDRLVVSTPGRVCLFGEHQDYLHLPVVACAISLRMSVAGKRRPEPCVHIALPDIDAEESFLLGGALEYVRERDYYRSVVNVLLKHGFSFSGGLDCVV